LLQSHKENLKVSASELANWWDEQNRQSKKVLEDWVGENPQWWAVGIATTVATAQDLGAGIVDMTRLGEGVAEGGWGYGKDALRLVGLAGPLGRGVRYLAKGTGVGINRILALKDPSGDICSYIANVQALRRTGARLFVTVADLAKASNIRIPAGGISNLPAQFTHSFVAALNRLGARVKQLKIPSRIEDVEDVVKSNDGVVIFGIRFIDEGKDAFHAIYAFKNSFGQIRYSDRYGQVFKNIEGFQKIFGGSNYRLLTDDNAMVLVQGARVLQLPSGKSALALAVKKLFVAKEEAVDTSTLMKSFEGKKKIIQKVKPTLPKRSPGVNSNLPPVKYLTGVQARLNNLGYGAGPVDGINGPRTKSAVKRFQQLTPPLRVDQIPGPNTQARLLEAHGC